jgi:alpha-ribazole phosphatase
MSILLIRHAETDMAGRFCGHSDPKLNAAGERQALRVAEEVSGLGIARIYSSDLRRAAQTAAAIAQRAGIAVNHRVGLREIDFGQWEGLDWRQIELRFPEEADLWLREFPLRSAPGGEAYSAFTDRVETTIATLLRKTRNVTTALVTHRGVMSYVLTKFFGIPEREAWAKSASYGATVIATNPACASEVLP